LISRRKIWLAAAAAAAACRRPPASSALTPADLTPAFWERLGTLVRGSTVRFGMWAGDEERNRYFQSAVVDAVKARYAIALRIVPNSDTAEVVNKLLDEKRAGKLSGGSIDAVWINGENFRAAKQGGLLWGPFADSVPNVRLFDDEIRRRDFGTAIDGYEAPWQSAEFVMGYDSARVPDPPRTFDALRAWAERHPGRFTYVAPPDFTGSVFIRHLLLYYGGGSAPFQNTFSEELYRRAAAPALAWLRNIKPYLWRHGETYPATLREQDRLFANNEIDFAMSYGPNFASQRIARGEFPPTTRTFVFDSGAIGNYSFLAIPFNAANPAGALAVIDFLMSFDQLLDLSRALGNPFPLRPDRLTAAQREAVAALPMGPATLPPDVLHRAFQPEPDAAYVERFEKDWFAEVLHHD
jgi:putative spermidine/putrescine transport system substrate-binding protein